jgi:succinate dehydrogenase / fumarate reductase iron-sulfur subunit
LFTSAKVAHLNLLPQGQAERYQRVESMVDTMEEYFGSCTNHAECQEACPKSISIDYIALMNRDYVKAKFKNRRLSGQR